MVIMDMSILDRPTVLLKSLLLLMVIMDMSIPDRPTVLTEEFTAPNGYYGHEYTG